MVNRIYKKVIIAVLAISLSLSGIVSAGAAEKKEQFAVIPAQENVKLLVNNKKQYLTINQAGDVARKKALLHNSNIQLYIKTTESSANVVFEKIRKRMIRETSDSNSGDYMYWNFKSSSAKYYYNTVVNDGKKYYYYDFRLNIKYRITLKQQNQVDKRVKSIIKKLKPKKKTSDYKKVKKVYDYICKSVTYAKNTSKGINYTAYAALFNKEAVCQGYALLAYKFFKELGLETRLIPGYSSNQLHGWNIVKVGKYYYNIDSTWDATYLKNNYKYHYFLKGDKFKNHKRFKQYKTDTFYGKYLMAANAYGSGKAKMCKKSQICEYAMKQGKVLSFTDNTLKFEKLAKKSKYTVEYSVNKKFKSGQTVTTTGNTVQLNNLENDKVYYVRYRGTKKIKGKLRKTNWSDTFVIEN